jgi:hypothetical protein
VADEVRPLLVAGVDHHRIAVRDVGEDVGDVALDRGRGDPVRRIIFALLLAPPSVSLSARSIEPVTRSA